MNVTDRFAELWHEWDDGVRTRADIPAFLSRASDQDLVELLAGDSPRDRKYERDILATEILNRLSRRQRDLPAAAEAVLRSAEAAYAAAADGQRAIHLAESILKASGDDELGSAVSASAYASLDTTKLAFEAAQQNSSDVHTVVSQSRVAHRLAEDASRTAEAGAEAARTASGTLERAGHAHEAAAARKAATGIQRAAEQTVEATRRERAVEGDL